MRPLITPLVGLALLAVTAPAIAEEPEPVWEGKKLSEWVAQLKDRDMYERCAATYALRMLGPKAKTAVPALIEVLKDKESDVRRDAVLALQHIGPAAKAAIPALTERMKDDNKYVRFWSVVAL